MFDVITFGSAIVDIFLKSSEVKLIDRPDEGKAICGLIGDKIDVSQKVVTSGGGGTNTAVSFKRLGLDVAVVARLGSDVLGSLIARDLTKEGITTNLLARKDEETDLSVILIGPQGERTIFVGRGETRLVEMDIDWPNLQSSWFYIASLEGNITLVEKLINFAQENNTKVAWNPGKKELEEREKIKQLAQKVDVFILNREESENLIDQSLESDSFWETMKSLKTDKIVVTDGRSGAHLLSEEGKIFKPSPQATPVDETGAGDAFGSAFVAGIIKGMKTEEAFSLAMKNGASVVSKIGAKTSLITLP